MRVALFRGREEGAWNTIGDQARVEPGERRGIASSKGQAVRACTYDDVLVPVACVDLPQYHSVPCVPSVGPSCVL